MNTPTTLRDKVSQSITPRRLRFLKESFTGYLFIAPALVLIFIFGLFPVAFALYVSVHKWRLVRTDFVGLNNFVRVVGNITYVAAFFLALGALLGAVLPVWGAYISFLLLATSPETFEKLNHNRSENHPSWKHMYLMMMVAQCGLAAAYLIR